MQTIEILGVIIIMALQAYVFWITYSRIQIYLGLLHEGHNFHIVEVAIPMADITTILPKNILAKLNSYLSDNPDHTERHARVSLVVTSLPMSAELAAILDSINTYLIRNRSAVADFNLIKDIIERRASAIEEDVNNTISIPLYLGLLGTLLGIIFGLLNISSFSGAGETTDILNEAIPTLLGGVKVAMFASFLGLLLTVINSGIFFRKAKTEIEERKNNFYSFIQIELLPVLNQSINSTLASLQTNLHKFNENFTENISALSGIMHKNHDAILAQDRVLAALESININEFAKANVRILTELRQSTDSFHSFNLYMDSINEALTNTKTIAYRLSQLISKTDSMNLLAENVSKSFAENNRLITFFNDHRVGFDESNAQLKMAVGGVSKTLNDAMEDLKSASMQNMQELRQIVTKEIKLMNDEYPKKWEKLDNLTDIKNDLSAFKLNTTGQIGSLKTEMHDYAQYLKSIDESLKKISNKQSWYLLFINKVRKARSAHFRIDN